VLFSRQILNGSQDFFHIFSIIFFFFFKYETIENHAHAFLALIISAVASVHLYSLSISCNLYLFSKADHNWLLHCPIFGTWQKFNLPNIPFFVPIYSTGQVAHRTRPLNQSQCQVA
jgi:hypothetical protein